MNRVVLVILAFVAFSISGFSQIAGISASKIAAMHSTPVDYKTAEFEPTFNYGRNLYGVRTDSVSIASNVSWRLTYGFSNNLELGFNSVSDFSSACMAAKYRIFEDEKIGFAAMAGLGTGLGNLVIAESNDLLSGYGFGLISTHKFDAKNSLDLNVQYYKNIGSFNSLIINADFGTTAFRDKWLVVAGLGYQTTSATPILTLYLGLSIETIWN